MMATTAEATTASLTDLRISENPLIRSRLPVGAGFATDSPPCYERPVTLGGSLSRPDPFGSHQNLPDSQPSRYQVVMPLFPPTRGHRCNPVTALRAAGRSRMLSPK